MSEINEPKTCPICGSLLETRYERYCEYACGSRFNYKRVVMVYAPQSCIDNQLAEPATEYMYPTLGRALPDLKEEPNEGI